MRVKSFVSFLSFALLLSLSSVTSSVFAKTPDGVTPAQEEVCDIVKGGTPGLYGLCVAYCEAQDLDAFPKKKENTRLLDNYNKKMRDGDPEMPCLDDGGEGEGEDDEDDGDNGGDEDDGLA